MKTLLLSMFLLVGGAVGQTSGTDCPWDARCQEHLISGQATGRVMWEGKTQYAEYSHPLGKGEHRWWVKCYADD